MTRIVFILYVTVFHELFRHHGLCLSETCVERMVSCADHMRESTIKTLMGAAKNQTTRNKFCGNYRATLSCITDIQLEDVKCQNDNDVILPKIMVTNGYGRFCNSQGFYSKYLSSVRCFETSKPAAACYDAYIFTLTHEVLDTSAQCLAISSLIQCVSTELRGSTCSNDSLILTKMLYPGAMLMEIYDCANAIRDKTGDDLYVRMADPTDRGSYLPWKSSATKQTVSFVTTQILVILFLIGFIL